MYFRSRELYNNIKETIIPPENICWEFSGRGYHIWIKLAKNTTLKRAWDLREYIRETFNLDDEIFPKQFEIENNGFGNWVKLPLSINRKNGKTCKILDDFDFSKQGVGYTIPNYIPYIDSKKAVTSMTKTTKTIPINFEINKECYNWFLDHIKPCLRAIAEGKMITHGLGNDIGHKMNLTLADSLIYLGASDEIIHKAFMKQPYYTYEKTQKQINSIRKNIKPEHIFIKCKTIAKRGFCIQCWKNKE